MVVSALHNIRQISVNLLREYFSPISYNYVAINDIISVTNQPEFALCTKKKP